MKGDVLKVDINFIKKMNEKYHEYANSSEKKDLNKRLIENEKWFRKKHNEYDRFSNSGAKKRVPSVKGGYLFNAIITKHADAMDNFPDISILPREEKDKELADTLTGVIPYILERCDFEKVYSDNWYSKLKTSACYSVVWDSDENNGKGDIKIVKTELLNLFWQPNISDIEQSEFVFYHTYIPKKEFIDLYGIDKLENTETVSHIDTYETLKFELKNEFVLIVDCYYKKMNKGKKCLHFAKFSGEQLLFSSEDEKNEDGSYSFPGGYYDHGKYPFIFDIMYPCEQSIAGFGVVDILKDIQGYIDATDELLQINNRIVGKPRLVFSRSLGINKNDLVDLDKEFIEIDGTLEQNSFYKIPTEALPAQVINSLMMKKEELKEIIGNRDFQQGGTSGGVTSGSAISILQSVGDKLSRDIIKSSYRCYKDIIFLVIELIRQFYDEERTVRITGKDGNDEFVKFSNNEMNTNSTNNFAQSLLNSTEPIDLGASNDAPIGFENISNTDILASDNNSYIKNDVPLFDIKLAVQKSNPYSRELNNQTILELSSRGLLNPSNFEMNLPTLNALQFDGKDALIKELKESFDKLMNKQTQSHGGDIPMNFLNGNTDMASQELLTSETGNSLPFDMGGNELIDVTDVINGG